MKYKLLFPVFWVAALNAGAHNPDDHQAPLREWHLHHHHLHASFLMMRGDTVFLETENGTVKAIALAEFSDNDQDFVRGKMARVEQINRTSAATLPAQPIEKQPVSNSGYWIFSLGVISLLGLAGFLLFNKYRRVALAVSIGGTAFLCAFKTGIVEKMLGTDPLFMDAAFAPFKPHIATHWDNTWFYVESNGIPTTHSMMTGITKWQQQVPTPQCYTGTNAWQIPLNPVFAATPVPVNQQHFLRGAVAIASNGIPIFNPYTNTGVDALLDGQLDQWGGHSGRADDYHYHIAPMFLDTQTADILPIAFALDGFAVYAGLEPDGSAMLPLDANHGHFDGAGGYHYHGTPEAPYMIGNMVGQVTEDATMQIIPQAKAMPVRPSLTPLSGATITDFQPNANSNGYILTYTRNGQTYQVDYSWTPDGIYTYNFIAPTGTITETYNGHLPCEVTTAAHDLSVDNWGPLVFPNPTRGTITLKANGLNADEVSGVNIFDTSGRLVFQSDKWVPGAEISGLSKGVYILNIQLKKGEISRKIVVQ